VFKLRTDPSNKDSQTYDTKVLTYRSGSVEEFLLWKKDLEKVLVGQNVTSAPGKYTMTRRLLDGDALAAFNKAATKSTQESNENYTLCMKTLAIHVFPKNALATQRQWFHRYLHKRIEDTMREFVARINEINENMVEFPPNFDDTQMISEPEMKDLLEFAVPTSWRVKMVEHAFRPIEHDIPDIVEFCERQEFSEKVNAATRNSGNNQNNNQTYQSQNKNGTSSKKGQQSRDEEDALTHAQSNKTNKHKRPKIASFKNSDGKDGCALHIWATDHTTAECRVISKQVDNMREQWNAQPHNTFKRQKTGNDKYNQQKKNGDLHTLLDDVNKVRIRLEKELKQSNTACGKRKKVSFVETEEQEKADVKDSSDDFHSELEQLTLSDIDVSEGEFEDLSDIE
jgi:hypothetical protein